jgi:hypothetical protein
MPFREIGKAYSNLIWKSKYSGKNLLNRALDNAGICSIVSIDHTVLASLSGLLVLYLDLGQTLTAN